VTEHDRRNWLAILWGFGLAAFSLLGTAWGIHLWANGEHDRLVGKMIVGGAIAGLAFTTVAIGELVWRLRHGPQEPGRHTRSD
jgi:hypothetical protein